MKHIKDYTLFESNHQNLMVVEVRDDESIIIGIVDPLIGNCFIPSKDKVLIYPYTSSHMGFRIAFESGWRTDSDTQFDVEPISNKGDENELLKSVGFYINPVNQMMHSNPGSYDHDIYVPSKSIMGGAVFIDIDKLKRGFEGGSKEGIQFMDPDALIGKCAASGICHIPFISIK